MISDISYYKSDDSTDFQNTSDEDLERLELRVRRQLKFNTSDDDIREIDVIDNSCDKSLNESSPHVLSESDKLFQTLNFSSMEICNKEPAVIKNIESTNDEMDESSVAEIVSKYLNNLHVTSEKENTDMKTKQKVRIALKSPKNIAEKRRHDDTIIVGNYSDDEPCNSVGKKRSCDTSVDVTNVKRSKKVITHHHSQSNPDITDASKYFSKKLNPIMFLKEMVMFNCSECDKKCSSKAGLERHINTMHKCKTKHDVILPMDVA